MAAIRIGSHLDDDAGTFLKSQVFFSSLFCNKNI